MLPLCQVFQTQEINMPGIPALYTFEKADISIFKAPITIDLRWEARQPAVSLSALLPKLLEWEDIGLTSGSKDWHVRKKVRQPASHSQRSIYAGRATI